MNDPFQRRRQHDPGAAHHAHTSLDHGTAHDIAGTGRAAAESMKAAIAMAAAQAGWLHHHRSNTAKSNVHRP